MDPRTTPNTSFDRQIHAVFDVDELLRVLAIELNIDHWGTWGGNRGKNCYFYQAPSDGRWRLIPWDLELTFSSVNRGEFALVFPFILLTTVLIISVVKSSLALEMK